MAKKAPFQLPMAPKQPATQKIRKGAPAVKVAAVKRGKTPY